ncbi:MAG: alpha/beta hydrolase [Streptosporangiaceae bacterium]
MVNPGTAVRAAGRGTTAGTSALVVVLHGGRSASTEPTTAVQPAVLRMIPVAGAIRHAVRGSGATVTRPRFAVRGWNGSQASPVGDLDRLLAEVPGRFGRIPVIIVGHSMGARAALRAAGHPLVTAVCGLAPWLPLGEPAGQLAGRRIMLAHGTADTVTSPVATRDYARRAQAVTSVTAVEIAGGEHAMLRRARLWHRLAAEFARAAVALPPGDPGLRQIIDAAAPPPGPVAL